MAWKNVQYKDGKMRTSNGGGGGASALTDLSDVSVSSPSNGQVLKYNNSTSKWENANESGGGHTYSTTEQVIGTWIDGKPLYEKTFSKTLSATSTGGGYGTAIDSSELPNCVIRFLSGYCGSMPFNGEFSRYDTNWEGYANIWGVGSNSVAYNFRWGNTASADAIIVVQYTKSTD